jgi:hypothetical protein
MAVVSLEHAIIYIEQTFTTGNGAALLTYIARILTSKTKEAFPESIVDQLGLLLRGAPKMRAQLRILRNVVVLNQKKVLQYCSLPSQMVYSYVILKACGLAVECYHAQLSRR